MARVIDYAGRILITAAFFALLGTVGAVDKSGLGLMDAMIQMAACFACVGIGAFMMKIGGKKHDN